MGSAQQRRRRRACALRRRHCSTVPSTPLTPTCAARTSWRSSTHETSTSPRRSGRSRKWAFCKYVRFDLWTLPIWLQVITRTHGPSRDSQSSDNRLWNTNRPIAYYSSGAYLAALPTNRPACSHRVWSRNGWEGCADLPRDVTAQMVYYRKTATYGTVLAFLASSV